MIADPVSRRCCADVVEVAALMRIKNISVVPVVDNPKTAYLVPSRIAISCRVVWVLARSHRLLGGRPCAHG